MEKKRNDQKNNRSNNRRPNWEERRAAENANIKDVYKVGQAVEGKIALFFKAGKEHPDASALVNLESGGTALLLYSEILGYPRQKLNNVYKVGEKINVEITAIRPSKNRISVSTKPVMRKMYITQLEPGSVCEATVIERVGYGYFVDLGGGLEALLHNENLDTDFHNRKESFEIGDVTQVAVLSIEKDGARIGVGRRQLFA
ncbi:MAG: S1 RNA-binding domain-containing protein [Cyanobacteria bacterium SZAS TMP-1]|nr:S1 RNA-binding domain-containing protein [Cyanobacteria bacterium SZAS TMP-1]